MKKSVCVGFLASLVVGAVCMGWLAFGRHRDGCPSCHGRAADVFVPPEGEIVGHPTPKSISRLPNIRLTDGQRVELQNVFRLINEAYTNCQVDVLRSRMARMPDYFYRVSQSDYLEFNGFLYREVEYPANCLDKGRIPLSRLIAVDDVKGFTNYVHACFEAARFSGGFYVRRGFYSDSLRRIEPKILYQLQLLKRHFNETGRTAFEKATDALITEWYGQIESAEGLTRRFAFRKVDVYLFARSTNPRKYWLSNEEILKIGRAQADSLVRLGYTPKWLDAEFPLPAEGKPYAGNPHVRFDEGASSSANAEVEGSTPLDP